MKSRRSVVKAILFVLRLQKTVTAHRKDSRSQATKSEHKPRLVRAESTRQRRRSSSKVVSRKRFSAPSSGFPLRSPSLLRALVSSQHHHYHSSREIDFGIFTRMSQPYSLGLDESRGRPLLSVCAGAAHALASTALLVRQQSLDEPSQERSFDGASARRSRVIRQGSVEGYEKKKKSDEGDHRKKIKNNMISHLGALIAVEANDPNALRVVLTKNAFDVDSKLNNCLYADYKIKWTLLDVALMLGYHECAQMLIDHGAQENILMNSITKRHDSLREAAEMTKSKMNNLKQAGTSKENEKQLKQLTAHCELLHSMSNHVTHNLKPGPPEDVRAVVTGATEVTVYFNAPSTSNSTVVKYKVEWCKSPDFDDHIDSWEETNMVKLPVRIGNLEKGIRLSFRVSSANIFDYSDTVAASPRQVHLSSWEDVDGRRDGRHEHMASISGISDQIDKHRNSLVWQRVFPTNEINLKKRKTGLKELFSASSKFSKNLQRGCYLATIIYTEGKVACTVDDCLPIIEVDETLTTVNRDDFHWLMKLSVCWDQLSVLLDYNPNAYSNTNSLSFRSKIIAAAQSMHSALGLKDIGRLYQQPIIHENIIFLVTVRFVPDTSYLQALTLRWMSFDKLLRKKTSCPALDSLNRNIVTVMNFFEACQISLKRGLYLCYLKLQSSINCARVVVPDSLPTVLPFVQVRDNPHVTEEEWAWIKATDQNETIRPTESQKTMHSQLCSAATALLQDLDVDPDLVPGHRLYRTEILQPHPDVSIILILPKPEEVCAAPTGSSGHGEFVDSRRGCYSLPIPIFEMAHLWTYHPDFITLYCRLSLFVEYFIMISQHEQRKSMLEHDVKVYQKQHEVLSNFQKQLEDVWRNARWISRIASIARDKNCTQVAVPLCRLMAPLQSGSNEDVTDVGYHSDQSGDKQDCDRPVARVRPQSHAGSPRSSSRTLDFEQLQITRRRAATVQSSPSNGITTTPRSLPQSPLLGSKDSEFRKEILLQNGVVKIYAAYDCGLPDGSSVRLSISPNTTSQEVVVYVVEQFAKATARIKKKDVEIPDAEDFCLASVVGPKEKMFKDDFPILRLQAPWNRGKLFVRRKDTILAAIYHGNESYV